MNDAQALANTVLWAAAIVAAAVIGAPAALWLVVLPTLAATSLIVARTRRQGFLSP